MNVSDSQARQDEASVIDIEHLHDRAQEEYNVVCKLTDRSVFRCLGYYGSWGVRCHKPIRVRYNGHCTWPLVFFNDCRMTLPLLCTLGSLLWRASYTLATCIGLRRHTFAMFRLQASGPPTDSTAMRHFSTVCLLEYFLLRLMSCTSRPAPSRTWMVQQTWPCA